MQITSINLKSPHCFKYGVLRWFFILCGGQFYLNWVLPTNPMSKNRLINLMWGGKRCNWWWKYNDRIVMCYVYGGIHCVFAGLNLVIGAFWSPLNILINLYPIIVQIYIGVRCWRIKNLNITFGFTQPKW